MTTVDIVTFRITHKDDQEFVGALSRAQTLALWTGIGLPAASVKGISLIQSLNRPFLVDFWLHQHILESIVPRTFSHNIGAARYSGEFVKDDSIIPLLGEDVKILIRRTRFRLKIEEIRQWLQVFGTIIGEIDFIRDRELTHILTDDVSCYMKLNRHVPGQLPAYGRKLSVSYKCVFQRINALSIYLSKM